MIAVNDMKLQNTKHNTTKDDFLVKMNRLDECHDSGPTESRVGIRSDFKMSSKKL